MLTFVKKGFGFRRIACAAFVSLVLASPLAAQQAAQVALIEGDAQGDYRAAGAVTVEMHSASNVLPKAKLDEQLRTEAIRLGADAVIQISYQMTPAGSGVDYKASGVAIRYARQTGAAAAVAAPAAAPVAPSAPAPAAAAPAPLVRAASATEVQLSEGALPGRRVVQLGPVSVTTHPTSMLMKVTPKEQAQIALKEAAFRLGADAVIDVTYRMVNSTFSKKGNTASGIAVRFE